MGEKHIKAYKGNTRPIFHGKDYTNKKIGSWLILGKIRQTKSKTMPGSSSPYRYRAEWLSQCDCGSEPKWVPKDRFFRQNNKGCGECRGERSSGENNVNWNGYKNISGTLYNRIKQNAKSRNIEFKLDISYLNNLWVKSKGKCALSGMDIDISKTASLDRIDSLKGYISGNVQWVHKNVNIMKRDIPQKEFIKICRAISVNHID